MTTWMTGIILRRALPWISGGAAASAGLLVLLLFSAAWLEHEMH